MHPWHDIVVDPSALPRSVPAVVEVPKGSKSKYEIDKPSGLLRLDRVLYSAVHYPANYGFIPRSYCDDGDPLDVLVLGQEPVHPLTLIFVRPIGVMHIRDQGKADDKILAVHANDPAVKVQLFRFIDALPQIRDPEDVTRHLQEYFAEAKGHVPGWIGWLVRRLPRRMW